MTLSNTDLDKIDKRNRENLQDLVLKRLDKIDESVSNLKKTVETHANHVDTEIKELDERISTETIIDTIDRIDMELHDRKWCIIISGIVGEKFEAARTTRDIFMKFAQFGIEVPCPGVAACHRLNYTKSDSPIYVRFCDIADAELWLEKSKELKKHPNIAVRKVYINVDLPPAIIPLKRNLLDTKRALPTEEREKAYLKYYKSWPYVKLFCGHNKTEIVPELSVEDFVKNYRKGKLDKIMSV